MRKRALPTASSSDSGADSGGRPPQTFAHEMRRLAEREETIERLKRVLASEDDTVFLKAFAEVANRGHGRATERIEMGGVAPLLIRVVHE